MSEARVVKIELTQWDERPNPTWTITRNGEAVDVSGETLKIYIWRIDTDTLVADGVAAIDFDADNGLGDGTDGKVLWDISDTEAVTDEAGKYKGQVVMTDATPEDETILTELDILVRPSIKGAD